MKVKGGELYTGKRTYPMMGLHDKKEYLIPVHRTGRPVKRGGMSYNDCRRYDDCRRYGTVPRGKFGEEDTVEETWSRLLESENPEHNLEWNTTILCSP